MRIVAVIARTALLALFGSAPATAATITVLPANSQGENIIFIEGEFTTKDHVQFQNKTDAVSKAIVAFNSPGGNADAGKIIGEIIRRKKYATFVAPDAECASACAMAWLGSSDRYTCSTARIGFHSALSSALLRSVSPEGYNAIWRAFLRRIGLSDQAAAYILHASPQSITWLTETDAKRYGIDVVFLDASACRDSTRFAVGSVIKQQLDPDSKSCFEPKKDDYFKESDARIKHCTALIQSGKLTVDEQSFTLYWRGFAYFLRRDNYHAIVDYTAAIKLKPGNSYYYVDRGIAYTGIAYYAGRNDYNSALADFSKAIDLDPENSEAFLQRATIYVEQKNDFNRSIADLSKLTTLEPTSSNYLWRGLTFEKAKDYTRAISDYTEAIKLYPDDLLAYSSRAEAYLELKNYERAIADYAEAIKREKPESSRYYVRRGQAYRLMKNNELAIADFRRALSIDPNDKLAKNNLIELREKP